MLSVGKIVFIALLIYYLRIILDTQIPHLPRNDHFNVCNCNLQ